MAELSTIARPYAEALFRVAEHGDLARWADIIAELAAVADNTEMRSLMADPKLTDDQIYQLFVGVLKSAPGTEAQNFLQTLVKNGRLKVLPEIARQFHLLKNAKENTADAEIASAFPLSDAQTTELVTALEHKFGVKLKPQVTVEPELIGGVRVVIGDQVLDSSVRHRLQQMQSALSAG
jgi:F-type H+-transporting ATPase subunit delta